MPFAHPFSSSVAFVFPDLHHPFEETNSWPYYVVGIFFTQGGNIISYKFGTI